MRKREVPPITPATFEKLAWEWLSGIKRGDVTAVMSYPSSDRQRRLGNILENPELLGRVLGNYRRYVWVEVDFRLEKLTTVPEIEELILSRLRQNMANLPHGADLATTLTYMRKRHKRMVFIGMGAEKLIRDRQVTLLHWVSRMYRQERLTFLLFFEMNLLSATALEVLTQVPTLQLHIKLHRLYGREDTIQWIARICSEWRMKASEAQVKEIVDECGHNLLFIKELLYFLRENPAFPLSKAREEPEMRYYLELQWRGFSDEERQILDAVIKREKLDEVRSASSLDYLEATGFISRSSGVYHLTQPLLEEYRREILTRGQGLKMTAERELVVNGTPVAKVFSPRQRRVLILLLEHPNSVVTRDQIARSIWGDSEEKYSDWAIDSLMSRLKLKLRQLGVDDTRLETKKGKGFIFHDQ